MTGLAAGEVARRLGVSVTTLRTWHQRYGLGPSLHEAGRHRRYAEADLRKLVKDAPANAPTGELPAPRRRR